MPALAAMRLLMLAMLAAMLATEAPLCRRYHAFAMDMFAFLLICHSSLAPWATRALMADVDVYPRQRFFTLCSPKGIYEVICRGL